MEEGLVMEGETVVQGRQRSADKTYKQWHRQCRCTQCHALI